MMHEIKLRLRIVMSHFRVVCSRSGHTSGAQKAGTLASSATSPPITEALLRIAILSCVAVALCRVAHAQTAEQTSIPGRFVSDISDVISGSGFVLTSPLRWRSKDWALFGGLVAGSVALSLIDENVNSFFQRNQGKIGDDLSEIGVELGEARVAVLLTGGVYAFGLIGDNDWARETAIILTASLFPMGSVQALTNNLAGRARPKTGEGAYAFDPFTRQEAYASFFSGHTLIAMSMAHVFAKRINKPAAKIFFYSAGSLAAASRLYNEDHWLTDVVFASVVSIASVNAVSNWLERKRHGKSRPGAAQLRVRPWLRGVQVGLEW